MCFSSVHDSYSRCIQYVQYHRKIRYGKGGLTTKELLFETYSSFSIFKHSSADYFCRHFQTFSICVSGNTSQNVIFFPPKPNHEAAPDLFWMFEGQGCKPYHALFTIWCVKDSSFAPGEAIEPSSAKWFICLNLVKARTSLLQHEIVFNFIQSVALLKSLHLQYRAISDLVLHFL